MQQPQQHLRVTTGLREQLAQQPTPLSCKQGYHVMVTTFLPGEEWCANCAFTIYCPQCTPDYQLPQHRRAYPRECVRHRAQKESRT